LIGGLVIVPLLLRAFGNGGRPAHGPGAPPSFGPLAFQPARGLSAPRAAAASPAGAVRGSAAAGSEPEDMVDAMIDVRRVEKQINAATIKRFNELLARHPEAVSQAMRRWLNDPGHR
jgi:hypothetical protein